MLHFCFGAIMSVVLRCVTGVVVVVEHAFFLMFIIGLVFLRPEISRSNSVWGPWREWKDLRL